MTSNRDAFIGMITVSELGQPLIDATDEGYNVLVGSTAQHPILFNSYATHPHILNKQFNSTAAGAGQIIYPTFVSLCRMKGYTDFSPATQRAMMIDLVSGRGALADVDSGNFAQAIAKCAAEWASLPGGTSGQHEQKFSFLQDVYTSKGGVLA